MKQILIADDEEFMRTLYKRMLPLIGYEVHVEPDGVQALRYFTQNQENIGLVITDNEMPGMRGVDLTSKIRELSPELPIILVSGTASEVEAKEAGATEFMSKPVTLPALEIKVNKYLPKQ